MTLTNNFHIHHITTDSFFGLEMDNTTSSLLLKQNKPKAKIRDFPSWMLAWYIFYQAVLLYKPNLNSSRRLIMDLSQPRGSPINDGIAKEGFNVQYTHFDSAMDDISYCVKLILSGHFDYFLFF